MGRDVTNVISAISFIYRGRFVPNASIGVNVLLGFVMGNRSCFSFLSFSRFHVTGFSFWTTFHSYSRSQFLSCGYVMLALTRALCQA